jgi:hypothetical protein
LILAALGATMNNVASTYYALGRLQDSVVMQEKALEFRQRSVPDSHSGIGAT